MNKPYVIPSEDFDPDKHERLDPDLAVVRDKSHLLSVLTDHWRIGNAFNDCMGCGERLKDGSDLTHVKHMAAKLLEAFPDMKDEW